MHLLHVETYQLLYFEGDRIPPYAILSHVWGSDEVTFGNLEHARSGDGFEKIKGTCAMAKSHGFDYVWVDTCCINKDSSAELSEALNSMYRWYQESGVCYAYLADVSSDAIDPQSRGTCSEFIKSKWFTRGWTLQELIAPSVIIFYNKTWQEIGTKSSLQPVISEITGIPETVLQGGHLEQASVAQRMSWASKRVTTRTEDAAYCLMGMFGINMPMLYGEGSKAFIRLQEEIIKISNDYSLFAWESPGNDSGILATSPAAFRNSSHIVPVGESRHADVLSEAITLNSNGVHLRVRFTIKSIVYSQHVRIAILPCAVENDSKKGVGIYVRPIPETKRYFTRTRANELELFDLEKWDDYRPTDICVPQERQIQKSHLQFTRAVENGHEAVVRLLLEKGSIPDEDTLSSMVQLAARNGHEAVVTLLLEKSGDSGKTALNSALLSAAKNGDETAVQLLLNKGDIVDDGVLTSALQSTVLNGHYSATEALFRTISHPDKESGSEFMQQFTTGDVHEAVVKLVLEKSGDSGKTVLNSALQSAAENGNLASVKLLLEKGASFDRMELGSVLTLAAQNGHRAVVHLLLEMGGGLDAELLRRAFQLAEENGYMAIRKLLLDEMQWRVPVSDRTFFSRIWQSKTPSSFS